MPEPDRHVTRTGEDYAEGMQKLLPLGQAWPRGNDSALMKVVRGLCHIWGDFEIRASKLLEQESDPRITIELLPDWERNWGLPDPCYSAPLTIYERQFALVQRMTIEGAQSREFFIQVAASIGYTITITEYRPFFVAMDRCGDSRVYGAGVTTDTPMRNTWGQLVLAPGGTEPVAQGALSAWPHYGLGPLANRYYWSVHVETAKIIWFRCTSGQCGVDPHLRIGLADDLECLLNRWKPAHTEIIFDYSGLNDPPEIILSASNVPETAPVNTIVGTFDIQNAYTGTPQFSLTNDAGGKFKIVGNQLQVAAVLDYETATAHIIEVAANDLTPIPGTSTFTITVGDVPEAGVIVLDNTTVAENTAIGTTVGTLSVLYTTGTPVFTLTSNPGGKFLIAGNALKVAAALDYETATSHAITVAVSGVTPSAPNAPLTITVSDVVEVSYATWDSATVASVTLSGGNLVATNTGTTSTNQGAHVAAASGKTTGKYYFEVKVTTFTNGAGVGLGFGNTSSTYANLSGSYVGGNMNLVVGHTGTGVITNPSGNSGFSLGALTSGDVVCVAVDVTNRLAWMRKGASGSWNGSAGGDPTNIVTGSGQPTPTGTIIPFVTFGSGLAGAAGVAGNVFTANFGASAFSGAVPSGYTPGWPT